MSNKPLQPQDMRLAAVTAEISSLFGHASQPDVAERVNALVDEAAAIIDSEYPNRDSMITATAASLCLTATVATHIPADAKNMNIIGAIRGIRGRWDS